MTKSAAAQPVRATVGEIGAAARKKASGGTLATLICDRVRADVLTGHREPGSRILLEDLKNEFGVSWSPIREAMSRLVAEGLIVAEEQRGYRVTPASSANLGEVIRLRLLLEPLALRTSIGKGDDAWEAEILAAHHRLTKFEARRWNKGESEQWETWHRRFHDALIRACESPILLQFCHTLHDATDRYRRIFLSAHEFDRDVAGEHDAITRAALARDARTACALLKSHVARTGSNIVQAMRD